MALKQALISAQGQNAAASPAHAQPDGGTGLGHQAPPNWPVFQAHGLHLGPVKDLKAGIASHAEAFSGVGTAESAAGEDPTGQSGGTMVSALIPSVM